MLNQEEGSRWRVEGDVVNAHQQPSSGRGFVFVVYSFIYSFVFV